MRHGLTPLNKEEKVNGEIDEPLAPEGIEQVKRVMLPKSVIHLYVSPLRRTRETADIINAERSLPISLEGGLTEIRMGSLAGKSWNEMEDGVELKRKHRAIEYNYRPYGGDSREDVHTRLLRSLGEIRERHNSHEALIVTHGGIIRFMNFLEQGAVIEDTVKNASLYTFNLDKILKHASS